MVTPAWPWCGAPASEAGPGARSSRTLPDLPWPSGPEGLLRRRARHVSGPQPRLCAPRDQPERPPHAPDLLDGDGVIRCSRPAPPSPRVWCRPTEFPDAPDDVARQPALASCSSMTGPISPPEIADRVAEQQVFGGRSRPSARDYHRAGPRSRCYFGTMRESNREHQASRPQNGHRPNRAGRRRPTPWVAPPILLRTCCFAFATKVELSEYLARPGVSRTALHSPCPETAVLVSRQAVARCRRRDMCTRHGGRRTCSRPITTLATASGGDRAIGGVGLVAVSSTNAAGSRATHPGNGGGSAEPRGALVAVPVSCRLQTSRATCRRPRSAPTAASVGRTNCGRSIASRPTTAPARPSSNCSRKSSGQTSSANSTSPRAIAAARTASAAQATSGPTRPART